MWAFRVLAHKFTRPHQRKCADGLIDLWFFPFTSAGINSLKTDNFLCYPGPPKQWSLTLSLCTSDHRGNRQVSRWTSKPLFSNAVCLLLPLWILSWAMGKHLNLQLVPADGENNSLKKANPSRLHSNSLTGSANELWGLVYLPKAFPNPYHYDIPLYT